MTTRSTAPLVGITLDSEPAGGWSKYPWYAVRQNYCAAVVAAGWQEAESDIDDVAEAARRDVINLRLYGRADEVFAADAGLLAAYRARQDRLQELQRLYGLRLRRTMAAAREMLTTARL